MISPDEGVRLIRAESQRMSQYFRGLPSEAFELPSACDGWTVADVVAHLVWAARDYYGVAIARGLQGDTSFPEGLSLRDSDASAAADETMLAKAIELRETLDDGLLQAFQDAFTEYADRLTGLSPQDWEKPVYHPSMVRPVSRYVPGMIQELVIHEWDIRSRLEPSPSPPAESLPVLMERIPGRPRPWIIPFESDSLSPLRYRFDLTNAGSGRWDAVVEDSKVKLEPSGDFPADITSTCSATTFVLLMYGRLTLESVKAAGQLMIAGDDSLVPKFDRWIKS